MTPKYIFVAKSCICRIYFHGGCPPCPRDHPAPPSDLIMTPLNFASGVSKINKNLNTSLVVKNQSLRSFYK